MSPIVNMGRYRPASFTPGSSFMSIIWLNCIWSPHPYNFHILHGELTLICLSHNASNFLHKWIPFDA
jgi:hypothetical protein